MKTTLAATIAVIACHADVEGFAPPKVATAPAYQMLKPTNRDVLTMPPLHMAQTNSDEELESSDRASFNPTPVVLSMMNNWMGNDDKKKTSNGMQLAAAAMAFALAFMPINDADAAMSGGRMGGSFSAPRQTMSRPAPSSSFSRGYSAGYMSRPSITVAPGLGYGYSPFMSPISPFSPFSPFAGPRVYGGPGVISVARGPSFFDLVFLGGFLFVASNVLSNLRPSDSTGVDWTSTASSALGPGTSVAQLSVALEVPNRDDRNSILSVLDRLSNTARTDSRVGIQNLTSQVALELLRRRSSIVSANASSKHFSDRNKALREFQSRSVKERSKFENENTSRYGGVDYGSRDTNSAAGNGSATMVVVTLVLAIDGDSTKMPRISSLGDVEDALRKLASDSKVDDCLQGAEILWTPEDRSESLSLRDVVADYPNLRAV